MLLLRFNLPSKLTLRGLRVWNYNAGGREGVCSGVKHCRLLVDGKGDGVRVVVRKAPGEGLFDYAQFVPLTDGFRNSSDRETSADVFQTSLSCSNSAVNLSKSLNFAEEKHIESLLSDYIMLEKKSYAGEERDVNLGNVSRVGMSEIKNMALSRMPALHDHSSGNAHQKLERSTTVSTGYQGDGNINENENDGFLDEASDVDLSDGSDPTPPQPHLDKRRSGSGKGTGTRRMNSDDSNAYDLTESSGCDAAANNRGRFESFQSFDTVTVASEEYWNIADDDDYDDDDDGTESSFDRQSVALRTDESVFDSSTLRPSGISTVCEVMQQYATPVDPCGCTLKIVIHSTWGDPYYVGLNGIAVYDEFGHQVDLCSDQVHATPFRDVNDLPEVRKKGSDARCLENLINSKNNTFNDRNMWLCPLSSPTAFASSASNGKHNSAHSSSNNMRTHPTNIFILLDEPTKISCLKIWNYSKTASRGAKEIEIFVDDVLVFRGVLKPSPDKLDFPDLNRTTADSRQSGKECLNMSQPDSGLSSDIYSEWGSSLAELDLSQSILFTNHPAIVERESARVPFYEETIEFIDEGVSVGLHSSAVASIAARPSTAVTGTGH